MSGAPRTSIALIACAASSRLVRRARTSSCGRRVWSMIPTEPSGSGQIERMGLPWTRIVAPLVAHRIAEADEVFGVGADALAIAEDDPVGDLARRDPEPV